MEYKASTKYYWTLIALAILWHGECYSKPIPCTEEALERAPKLIEFNFGDLDGFRVEIDTDSVKLLKSTPNKIDSKDKYLIVEVWGRIYKGNYRTRFTFSTKTGGCLLVGQEILEIGIF